MSFEDKIAIVTGAASGIGRATVETLAEGGATVIVADINREQGEVAAAAICQKGQRAQFLPIDLTDPSSITEFAGAVHAQFGAADILVNGAGWGKTMPFWETTPELWAKLIALNFVGPMLLAKAVLPKMMERGRGKIVNIASDAGRVGSLGETVYSGAKGGLIAFTKSLARETARYNINVNCVCPGPCCSRCRKGISRRSRRPFHSAVSANPRRSPMPSCSSRVTARATSPDRS